MNEVVTTLALLVQNTFYIINLKGGHILMVASLNAHIGQSDLSC